jgi:hypothetical protein
MDILNVEFIEKSVCELHMKRVSNNDRCGLSVEHIVYAHPIIVLYYLEKLFHMIVQHGHVPTYYFKIDVIPIMKDSKKGCGSVDNYNTSNDYLSYF